MNDMANLITQRKATNERQRVEYESQLHRILAAQLPPIKMAPVVSGPMPSQGAAKPYGDLELIPEAPKLPSPARDRANVDLTKEKLLILGIHLRLRVLHRALLRE